MILKFLIILIVVILGYWWTDGSRKIKAKKIIKDYENGTHNDEIAYIIAKRILNDAL